MRRCHPPWAFWAGLLAAGSDGALYRMEPETGQETWAVRLGSHPVGAFLDGRGQNLLLRGSDAKVGFRGRSHPSSLHPGHRRRLGGRLRSPCPLLRPAPDAEPGAAQCQGVLERHGQGAR